MAEQMTHAEFSARGGKSKSPLKLKAVMGNLAKARSALNARRAAQKVGKMQSA